MAAHGGKKKEGTGLQAARDGHLPRGIDERIPDDGRTELLRGEVVVDRIKYEEDHKTEDQEDQRADV